MEPIPVPVQLHQLEVLFLHIAWDLQDMSNIGNFSDDVFWDASWQRDAMVHRLLTLAEMASRLSRTFMDLFRMAPAGTLTAPKLRKQPPMSVQNAETNFHPFHRLPTELRLMVWEAAALPPACAHYIQQNGKPIARKRTANPLTPFMADHGLWWACKESQGAVERVYKACEEKVNATSVLTGGAVCTVPDDKFERHYRRLTEFNQECRLFQCGIRRLYIEFRRNLDNMIPPMCVVRDLYTTRSHTNGGLILVKPTIRVSTIFKADFAFSSPHVTPWFP